MQAIYLTTTPKLEDDAVVRQVSGMSANGTNGNFPAADSPRAAAWRRSITSLIVGLATGTCANPGLRSGSARPCDSHPWRMCPAQGLRRAEQRIRPTLQRLRWAESRETCGTKPG